VALVGCAQSASKSVNFSDATRNYRPSDYSSVYESWTRHAKLWQEVGTVIEAWATYKSWDFRQAYVSYYASIYDLSDSDRATLLRSQLEASRASHEFHVAVQMTTDKWNDLDRKNSPWRVTLLDASGGELGPTTPAAPNSRAPMRSASPAPAAAGSFFRARQAVVSSCGLPALRVGLS
jgi:hypothetical protein